MKRLLLSALVLALLATGGAARAAQSNDKTPPSYDMKPQSLQDLENLHKKFVSLAEAIPPGKYNWRPSEGARSFAEVFLHVSGERYQILNLMGTPLPSGFDGKTFEKSTTDKAQIIDQLNRSWDYAKAAINGMTNADFAKPLPKLGPDANAGDVVYILVADAHEHLGQSIAYARVNGVVPPWTVAAQKAAEKKDQRQKQ
ncbi:MAG: DinB family protein [Candidatus Acidiferrales bacterium]